MPAKNSGLCAQATSLHPVYILLSLPLYSVLPLCWISTESFQLLCHAFCTSLAEELLPSSTREDKSKILKELLDPVQLKFLQVEAQEEKEEPASKKVQTRKPVDVTPFPSYYLTQYTRLLSGTLSPWKPVQAWEHATAYRPGSVCQQLGLVWVKLLLGFLQGEG